MVYDRAEKCPKCGSVDHDLEWVEAFSRNYAGNPLVNIKEHIRITCGTCKFLWVRLPIHPETV